MNIFQQIAKEFGALGELAKQTVKTKKAQKVEEEVKAKAQVLPKSPMGVLPNKESTPAVGGPGGAIRTPFGLDNTFKEGGFVANTFPLNLAANITARAPEIAVSGGLRLVKSAQTLKELEQGTARLDPKTNKFIEKPMNLPFDTARIGKPEGIQSLQKRMIDAAVAEDLKNPPKTELDRVRNAAIATWNSVIPDTMEILFATDVASAGLKAVYKSTDPELRTAMEKLRFTDVPTRQEFIETIQRVGTELYNKGDLQGLRELKGAAEVVADRFSQGGKGGLIPNTINKKLADISRTLTSDWKTFGTEYGVAGLGSQEMLPGKAVRGRPQPAMGLSIVPEESVGYGAKKSVEKPLTPAEKLKMAIETQRIGDVVDDILDGKIKMRVPETIKEEWATTLGSGRYRNTFRTGSKYSPPDYIASEAGMTEDELIRAVEKRIETRQKSDIEIAKIREELRLENQKFGKALQEQKDTSFRDKYGQTEAELQRDLGALKNVISKNIEPVRQQVSSENRVPISETDPRNFKTAEEYVKAQPNADLTARKISSSEAEIDRVETANKGKGGGTNAIGKYLEANPEIKVLSGSSEIDAVGFWKKIGAKMEGEIPKDYNQKLVDAGEASPEYIDFTLTRDNFLKNSNYKTKSQLIDEWNKANKKIVLPKAVKTSPVKKQIERTTGIKPPQNKITKTEESLLKERLKNQARGARIGFKAGSKQARKEIIDYFTGALNHIKDIRAAIRAHIEDMLPPEYRGRFLSALEKAKSDKDLAKVFARVDAYAHKVGMSRAITKLRETIAKATESSSISVDYRNKIGKILENYELKGHTKETMAELRATQEYINREIAAGREVEMPQRILDKLKILGRIPKESLTLENIETLQSEVELLIHLGQTKLASKQALYESERAFRTEELLRESSPINSTPLPQRGLGDPKSWIERFIKMRNYGALSKAALRPIDGLAELTGMIRLKRVMDLGYSNYLTENDALIERWYQLTKDLSKTEFERIGAYAITQQEGGLERLIQNNGLKTEEISNIKLTPKEQEVYNFVRKEFDEMYPRVKKYMADVYNEDVGQIKNYVSFISDNESLGMLESHERFNKNDSFSYKTKTTRKDFTKERAQMSGSTLELNINNIFHRHIDDVSYMLNLGRDIKMYSEIINTPEMTEKLGEIGSIAWREYMNLMARNGRASGNSIAMLDILRRNMIKAVFPFRLSSALVQLSSFGDTMMTIGPEWALAGAQMAASSEWRMFVIKNFPEVKKAIGDDISMRELQEGLFAETARIGIYPMRKLDAMMRITAALGSYKKVLFEKGIPLDINNPNKEAIQLATEEVRNSQGSSFIKDQPLAISAGLGFTGNTSLNKTLFTFQSFMLSRWENINRQVWRYGFKAGDYKKGLASFFWIIVSIAIEEGIRRGSRKAIGLVTGNEKEEQPFLSGMADQMLQTIPVMGSVLSSLAYGANPVPVINVAENVISGGRSMVMGISPETKLRGGVRFAGSVGTLSGVPGSSQLSQVIEKAIGVPTELEKLNSKEAKEAKDVKARALEKFNELSKLSKEERKAQIQVLINEKSELIPGIVALIKKEASGITEEETQIKSLGVDNGYRAKYLYELLGKLSPEERQKKIKEYVDKKIITDKVAKQLVELIKLSQPVK